MLIYPALNFGKNSSSASRRKQNRKLNYLFSPGNPCPVGHFCKCQGGCSIAQPCDVGTFQDTEGQAECKACTEGNYCPHRTMNRTLECTEGYESLCFLEIAQIVMFISFSIRLF